MTLQKWKKLEGGDKAFKDTSGGGEGVKLSLWVDSWT